MAWVTPITRSAGDRIRATSNGTDTPVGGAWNDHVNAINHLHGDGGAVSYGAGPFLFGGPVSAGGVFVGGATPPTGAIGPMTLQGVVGSQVLLGCNVYYDTGAGWTYTSTDRATAIRMNALAGGITFHAAPSGTGGTNVAGWDTTYAVAAMHPSGGFWLGASAEGSSDPGVGVLSALALVARNGLTVSAGVTKLGAPYITGVADSELVLPNNKRIIWDTSGHSGLGGSIYLDASDVLNLSASGTVISNGLTVASGGITNTAGALAMTNDYSVQWGGSNVGIYGDSAGAINLKTGGAARVSVSSGGVISLGSPGSLSGASAGEDVIGNALFHRASNHAGTATKRLIGLNASDQVVIDPDNLGTAFGGTVSTDHEIAAGGSVYPANDNAVACGGGSNRWTTVYAVAPAINTSSRDMKEILRQIAPGEALQVLRGLRAYRYFYKDGNGQPNRRLVHTGPLADEIHPHLLAGSDEVSAATYATYAMRGVDDLVSALLKKGVLTVADLGLAA